ncbi:MAG: DNA repair protein RecO [Alistipes sp.]|nr:DNA repair protein RecO [Alistipes sp.]
MRSYKTQAIVLGTVKYGDKAVIVNMLTKALGRQSYIVQGLGSGKGRGSKLAYFQPLFLLEFEGLISDKSDLHRIKDLQSSVVLQSIPYDIRKSTIALFISEVLYRLIGESEANDTLFDFVYGSVEALDSIDEGVANFHLWFLANISRFLGFAPGNDYIEDSYFDMREGLYTPIEPRHDRFYNREYARLLNDLIECDVQYLGEIGLNRTQRVDMLHALTDYYKLHLDSISKVQSINILQQLF